MSAPLKKPCTGQMGFTLIELISTLVILSTLAAIVIPKYVDVEQSSRLRAIDLGVSELNGRETLTWALVKLSDAGYTNDQAIWDGLDTNLGGDYKWSPPPPKITGGTLQFKDSTSANLVRSQSNTETPAKWRR